MNKNPQKATPLTVKTFSIERNTDKVTSFVETHIALMRKSKIKSITVTIAPCEKPLSVKQLQTFHGIILTSFFQSANGEYSKEWWKNTLKHKFLSSPKKDIDGFPLIEKDGSVDYVIPSFSELTVKEMQQFTTNVLMYHYDMFNSFIDIR